MRVKYAQSLLEWLTDGYAGRRRELSVGIF
jgi:hypothetical protein